MYEIFKLIYNACYTSGDYNLIKITLYTNNQDRKYCVKHAREGITATNNWSYKEVVVSLNRNNIPYNSDELKKLWNTSKNWDINDPKWDTATVDTIIKDLNVSSIVLN